MFSNTLKMVFGTATTGLLLLSATSVNALGLGNLDLQSRLNQRFNANIPLIVEEDTDESDISVKLAGPDEFKRAGLKKGGAVHGLRFSPARTAEGQMIIKISSQKRIIEPMLSFVLEVEQGGTRTFRQYTAMLEAPLK